MDLIKIAEEAFATGKQHPSFKAGDTDSNTYRSRWAPSMKEADQGRKRKGKKAMDAKP